MRKYYRTVALALASLFPIASSLGAEAKLVKAVSEHFELYTTDNEALAKPALEHFETVRAYLLKATNSQDPFQQPIRIVGFKSWNEFNGYLPKNVEGGRAFSIANANRVTIAMAGLKKEMYEYGMREYVALLLNRTAPKLPYWLKMGLGELYCTLRPENGRIFIGYSPTREYRLTTMPDLNMSVLMTLKGGAKGDKGAGDFNASTANSAGGTGSSGSTRSSAFGSADGLDQVATGLTMDFGVVTWQLTHMLMFQKDYSAKFGAFVSALAGGEESTAALGRIYGQSLAGLGQDLQLYFKMPSHAVGSVTFQLDKPVTPQTTQLAAAESAPILADLKAGK